MRTSLFLLTLLLSFVLHAQPTTKPGQRVKVADLEVVIPGQDTAKTAAEFFYAFEVGDAVMLDITMDNAPGTNDLLVSTYPAGVEVHHDRALPSMSIQRFTIRERGIYHFTLSTKHAVARKAMVQVWRNPASAATQDFKTNVSWKKIYTPVQVCEQQEFFVNSATKLGGRTRTALPVALPPNTIEWYYRYSASREQVDIDRVSKRAGLLAELAIGLATSGASSLLAEGAAGLTNVLTLAPGADYCDLYLLDQKNYSPFMSQTPFSPIGDGTRMNLMSGNVRVTCCPSGQYYLGVRNNDKLHGIHVFLDAVAITAVEDWVMETN